MFQLRDSNSSSEKSNHSRSLTHTAQENLVESLKINSRMTKLEYYEKLNSRFALEHRPEDDKKSEYPFKIQIVNIAQPHQSKRESRKFPPTGTNPGKQQRFTSIEK